MADENQKEEVAQAPKTEPQPTGPTFPFKLPLRKSVIANGDEVTELVLREPTAADIEAVGNPVNLEFTSMSERPKTTFDAKAMTMMLARLATVPPSTIRQMHPRDWNNAAWVMSGFFMPEF